MQRTVVQMSENLKQEYFNFTTHSVFYRKVSFGFGCVCEVFEGMKTLVEFSQLSFFRQVVKMKKICTDLALMVRSFSEIHKY